MIFGKRQKHKLPRFPEAVASTFHSYCEALPFESLDQIRSELEQSVNDMYSMAQKNQRLDTRFIDDLAEASRSLLDRYGDYDAEQQALIIGAIRYFLNLDDPVPDHAFASGFVDDAMVMNHVLEQLGEESLIIPIS